MSSNAHSLSAPSLDLAASGNTTHTFPDGSTASEGYSDFKSQVDNAPGADQPALRRQDVGFTEKNEEGLQRSCTLQWNPAAVRGDQKQIFTVYYFYPPGWVNDATSSNVEEKFRGIEPPKKLNNESIATIKSVMEMIDSDRK